MEESDLKFPPDIEEEENPSRTAARFSYKATLGYPGCAAAEGVELARLCKRFDKDPGKLESALLEDEEQIQWLIDEGNRHHPLNGVETVVARPRMIDMIKSTFNHAKHVMGNTEEEIAGALSQYPKYKNLSGYDERGFGEVVMLRLTSARGRRANQLYRQSKPVGRLRRAFNASKSR